VAQERLAIHLRLAAFIFSACLWVAGGLGYGTRILVASGRRRRLSFFANLLLVLVLVQIGAGALVAGLRAGYAYNTWPLMDDSFVPPSDELLRLSPWWSNLVDNVALVQFDHRVIAYVLLALSLFHLVDAAGTAGGRAARGAGLLFGHVSAQVVLGITTLLLVVPLWAGLAHQALAMGVLAVATLHARRLRDAETPADDD
jgi:cytochrome c oxidase assembly protein subunit 15